MGTSRLRGALPSSGQRCSELGKNGRYYLVLGTVGYN